MSYGKQTVLSLWSLFQIGNRIVGDGVDWVMEEVEVVESPSTVLTQYKLTVFK